MAIQVTQLIENMENPDKDIRYMAASDCLTDVMRDSLKLDEDLERRLVRKLLLLLEDKSSEVQNQGVRCLSALVPRVKPETVTEIITRLCQLTMSDKDVERETGSMALKNVIMQQDANTKLAAEVAKRVCPMILQRLQQGPTKSTGLSTIDVDYPVRLELLDVLSELLKRHSLILNRYHVDIEQMLHTHLQWDRATVRKRTICALSHLLANCSNDISKRTCTFVINKLQQANSVDSDQTRTFVNCVSSLARSMPAARLSEHLAQFVKAMLQYAGVYAQDECEMAECGLHAIEALIYKCPRDIKPFLKDVLELAADALCYDPNYQYDDIDNVTDGEEDAEMDVSEDEESQYSDDEYTDDEDLSWKVRRAAAKTLEAVINTQRDHLDELYQSIAPIIVSRLKEREENVKLEVFNAMTALLKQTRLALPQSYLPSTIASSNVVQNNNKHIQALFPRIMSVCTNVNQLSKDEAGLFDSVLQLQPALMKALQKQLKDKSIRIKQSVFTIFISLVHVIPDAFAQHMSLLLQAMQSALDNNKKTDIKLKIEALSFLSTALAAHQPGVFSPVCGQLVPLIISCINEQHKVSQEALNTTHALIFTMRPMRDDGTLAPSDEQMTKIAQSMYQIINVNLAATGIDHEVRERTIACLAQLVASFADVMPVESQMAITQLGEKMKNELMRLVTVKSFITIARSPLAIDLSSVAPTILLLSAEFLKKAQRALIISNLALLHALFSLHDQTRKTLLTCAQAEHMLTPVMKQLVMHINDADLQCAHMAVSVVNEILRDSPQVLQSSIENIRLSILVLSHSSLLGTGINALNAVLTFWRLYALAADKTKYKELLSMMTSPVLNGAYDSLTHANASVSEKTMLANLSRQYKDGQLQLAPVENVAKCVAQVAVASGSQAAQATADNLASSLEESKAEDVKSEQRALFYLHTLGELARLDSKSVKMLKKPADQLIGAAFKSTSEHVKTAASYALGCLAVGNLQAHLPSLLREIESKPRQQYLLLHALKEVIGGESMNKDAIELFKPNVDTVYKVLMAHAATTEEGTRGVVAECLGKLCLVDPMKLIPLIANDLTASNDATVRNTIVTSVKFIIRELQSMHNRLQVNVELIDNVLQQNIATLLSTLKDQDINSKRAALVSLNTAAHNRPHLVRDIMLDIMPLVYAETAIRRDLIREISMGPFTHTVDDGLELRKAAFECMYTLLDTCIERINVQEFIHYVGNGLADQHDIKLLTHLMLVRLANIAPVQILQNCAPLVEALKLTLGANPKPNAVKSEQDKFEEAKRSAMRAVVVLLRMPISEHVQPLVDLEKSIQTPELQQMYNDAQRDPANRALLAPIESADESMMT